MISIVWLSFIAFNEFFVCLVLNENVKICSNNFYNICNTPNEIYGEHNIGNKTPVQRLEKKQAHNGNITGNEIR